MFEFESSKVTFEKMKDGRYKIIARIDIYKDNESIEPFTYRLIEFKLPLSDIEFAECNEHTVFNFNIEGNTAVTISCNNN